MKHIFVTIGAFLAGIVMAVGGIAMAEHFAISVDGVQMTPDNTETVVDGNGNGSASIKKEEAPAEEDPLPADLSTPLDASTTQSQESTATNCVQ